MVKAEQERQCPAKIGIPLVESAGEELIEFICDENRQFRRRVKIDQLLPCEPVIARDMLHEEP